jgi:nucleotide-binding universal stress UspA family protein
MTATTARDVTTVEPLPPAGTIVVGVDGSESSKRAAAWAAVQAAAEGRGVTLAHAILPPDSAGIDYAPMNERGLTRVRIEAEQMLTEARRVVSRYAGRAEIHEYTRVADPRDLLLDLAGGAAEVVVGSRGRGPVRSLLLGSVGVTLTRNTPCPVVVHRSGNEGRMHTSIIAGVDGTVRSRVVLEYAFAQASLRRLPLTVVHCIWDAQAAAVGPAVLAGAGAAAMFVGEAEESVESARLLVAEAIAGLCEDHPDVPVRTELARGLAADALVRLSDRADLVVVGSHHGGVAASILLGSVATDVVEHAHCPVAIIPVD